MHIYGVSRMGDSNSWIDVMENRAASQKDGRTTSEQEVSRVIDAGPRGLSAAEVAVMVGEIPVACVWVGTVCDGRVRDG